MSRSLPIAFTAALAFCVPAYAQDSPERIDILAPSLRASPPEDDTPREEVTAEQVFERAEAVYGPPEPEPECEEGEGDEIVVCAQGPDDPEQHRLRSREEAQDDYAARTMNRGNPQTPDPCGPNCGIFSGPATVGGLCGIGLNPCPPPPAYFIDFSTLPEAPPGSDADRIARGLPPLGRDVSPEEVEEEDSEAQAAPDASED
ncbi:hypothetical protein [Erythrobacter sp. HKB08]|uniref:hypothetical protein n=1 Tax=Erythrobacter sp. HKB08 TaxID=2502843 RepID=UPI001008F205|nr:hypothetical protein [Erythrobacter sp. HKB08]